jgi:imidazolonepropionase-like amidohydrolase
VNPRRPDLILADRLIDGVSPEPLERRALFLRDGRIVAILPQCEVTRSHRQGAAEIEIEDGTVLPGLSDTHVHLTLTGGPTDESVTGPATTESDAIQALRAVANAQAHLAAGVTTVRDVGCRGYTTFAVRDLINQRLLVGPRIQASGPPITTPTGHMHYMGCIATNADEIRSRAEEVLDRGADLVKTCATGGVLTAGSNPMDLQYTAAELREVVLAAEARGKIVAAHALAAEGVRRCVEAGVRSIEHCRWQVEPGRHVFPSDLAETIIAKDIFAGITFATISQVGYRQDVLKQQDVWVKFSRERLNDRFAAEREMIAAGVKYVVHSDAGVTHTPFGEFWKSVGAARYELRLSPLEAIRAVTGSPAALMGLHKEVGTLEVGKRADLLCVHGNPGVTIEDLRNTLLVLQDGAVTAEAGHIRL